MVVFKIFRIQFSKVFDDSNYIILGLLDSLRSGLSLSKLPIENKPRVGRNYVIALHIEQKSKEQTELCLRWKKWTKVRQINSYFFEQFQILYVFFIS